MIWSPDSWGWFHVKVFKYVDDTKIKDNARRPVLQDQQALAFNKTFKDGMNSPFKVSSAFNHLDSELSFILVFTYIEV